MAGSPDCKGKTAVEKVEPVPWDGLQGKSESPFFYKKPVQRSIERQEQQRHQAGYRPYLRVPGGKSQRAEKPESQDHAQTPGHACIQIVDKIAIAEDELSPW